MTRTARADQAVGFCDCNDALHSLPCKTQRGPNGRPSMYDQIREHCGVSETDNNRFRRDRLEANRRLQRKTNRRRSMHVRNLTWKDRNCQSMLFNPGLSDGDLQNHVTQLRDRANDLVNDIDDIISDIAWEIGMDVAEQAAVRAGTRVVASRFCGPYAWFCAVASLAYSAVETAIEAADAIEQVQQAAEIFYQRKAQMEALRDAAGGMLGDIEAGNYDEIRSDLMGQMEDAMANNRCLQARRCFLVPYRTVENQIPNFTRSPQGRGGSSGDKGIFDRAPFDMGESRGCCPGQTGHHLVPDSWMKDEDGNSNCTGNYNKNHAPTACLEGSRNRGGTHGDAHDSIDDVVRERGSDPVSMDEAIDMATEAYTSDVGSHCNPECIREQLKEYYENLGCSPTPTLRGGQRVGPASPPAPTEGESGIPSS